MNMRISAKGFSLTGALINAVELGMARVLESNKDISEIDIRLDDVNGRPNGGTDKRCQIVMKMAHAPSVIIRSSQPDIYLAIKHCSTRAMAYLADSDTENEAAEASSA